MPARRAQLPPPFFHCHSPLEEAAVDTSSDNAENGTANGLDRNELYHQGTTLSSMPWGFALVPPGGRTSVEAGCTHRGFRTVMKCAPREIYHLLH